MSTATRPRVANTGSARHQPVPRRAVVCSSKSGAEDGRWRSRVAVAAAEARVTPSPASVPASLRRRRRSRSLPRLRRRCSRRRSRRSRRSPLAFRRRSTLAESPPRRVLRREASRPRRRSRPSRPRRRASPALVVASSNSGPAPRSVRRSKRSRDRGRRSPTLPGRRSLLEEGARPESHPATLHAVGARRCTHPARVNLCRCTGCARASTSSTRLPETSLVLAKRRGAIHQIPVSPWREPMRTLRYLRHRLGACALAASSVALAALVSLRAAAGSPLGVRESGRGDQLSGSGAQRRRERRQQQLRAWREPRHDTATTEELVRPLEPLRAPPEERPPRSAAPSTTPRGRTRSTTSSSTSPARRRSR